MILHVLQDLPRDPTNFLLAAMKLLIETAFEAFPCTTPSLISPTDLLRSFPLSIADLLPKLGLETTFRRFVCCKKCFSLYPLERVVLGADGKEINEALQVPPTCTYTLGKKTCGKPLFTAPESRIPVRQYFHQPLHQWLGRLLMRPGLEKSMDEAWNREGESSENTKRTMRDIWDGPLFQSFKGPDGKTLFSECPGNEAHYVFSLSIDWFNVYKNRKGGKNASVGAIFMICLNLPLEIRYKLENVYLVGITPGPRDPSKDQINHFLAPLVDDLLEHWDPGVFYRETASYPEGHLVRCALIPIVCDIPAMRKTAGFAGHSATLFCSFCTLPRQRINDIVDPALFLSRDCDSHRLHADRWLAATSETARDALVTEYGVRWSQLLRLGYMSPVDFSTLDVMHNMLLGNLQHHCRRLLKMPGIRASQVEDHMLDEELDMDALSKKNKQLSPEEEHIQYVNIVKIMHRQAPPVMARSFSHFRKSHLKAMCLKNGLNVIGGGPILYKADYAEALSVRPLLFIHKRIILIFMQIASKLKKDISIPALGEKLFETLPPDVSEHLMAQIRKDITEITLPSWISAAPKNFGLFQHGKLKADEWRTMGTIILPLSLGIRWSGLKSTERQRELLANFFHLVIAVNCATRRSVSEEDIIRFDTHMTTYVREIVSLFGPCLVPNNHLSLHLPGVLRKFGPAHNWWSYPFERYNGIISRIRTNYKIGSLVGFIYCFKTDWFIHRRDDRHFHGGILSCS